MAGANDEWIRGMERSMTGLSPVGYVRRVMKKGSIVSILRVLTKRGRDDEGAGGVSTEIRLGFWVFVKSSG
jgi:hypothetical protein